MPGHIMEAPIANESSTARQVEEALHVEIIPGTEIMTDG